MLLAGILRLFSRTGKSVPIPILNNLLCKHLILPALFNKHHVHRPKHLGLELSIPTRLESLFLCIFFVLNIVLVFVNFDLFEGNYYWPKNIDQFNRYVADRTAILSIAQFPFLFAFAGRNTIFIWLTGWSFETFSVFHKWVARVSVTHAFVHTIVYTVIFYREGGLSYMMTSYKDVYLQWGAVAMVAGFVLVSGAVYGIRKRWYEIFLVSHIIFAVLWLVGTFYHVKLLKEPRYIPWFWTAIAFWAFDRAIRLLRLATINHNVYSRSGEEMLSTITMLGDDVFKLQRPITRNWRSSPGQYVFLYFPQFGFWQSHPFTILDVAGTMSRVMKTSDKSLAAVQTYEMELEHSCENKLSFIFRAHDGITRKILRAVTENGGTLKTRVLIEGPYGSTHDLDKFDKVVLLAGGMGITACLPFLMKIMQRDTAQRRQDVVLHWIVRDEDSLSWVSRELQRALDLQTEHKQVHPILHVTYRPQQKVQDSHGQGQSNLAVTNVEGLSIKYGRPLISGLVHESVLESISEARIAVLACGPGQFSDDCRRAVVTELGASRCSIQYFEESFTW